MQYSKEWVNSTIWEIDTGDKRAKIFIEGGDIPMWVSLGDCRQPLEGEDYITDDDDGNESEDYNNDYADDDVDDIVNEEGDYDVAYPKMDVAWEELLEYLEEQEMDLSDLSDEEFIELMDKMYNDL